MIPVVLIVSFTDGTQETYAADEERMDASAAILSFATIEEHQYGIPLTSIKLWKVEASGSKLAG